MSWKHNPVGVYIMSCYAYEVLSDSFITDAEFDACGWHIAEEWDNLTHRHRDYINREACAFTSALTVPYEELPLIALSATHHKLGTRLEDSPIYNKIMEQLEFRQFI